MAFCRRGRVGLRLGEGVWFFPQRGAIWEPDALADRPLEGADVVGSGVDELGLDGAAVKGAAVDGSRIGTAAAVNWSGVGPTGGPLDQGAASFRWCFGVVGAALPPRCWGSFDREPIGDRGELEIAGEVG